MTKQELTNLCKEWSEYLQQYSNEKYFIGENGKLMFQTDDFELMDTTEGDLVEDINDTFDEHINKIDRHNLFIDFIEKILMLEYGKPQWQMVLNLLNAMPRDACRNYVESEMNKQFSTPAEKVDFLMCV